MENFNIYLGLEEELSKYQLTGEKFEKIYQFSKLIPMITNQRLDKWNGLQLANHFLVAMDFINELYSLAIRLRNEINSDRKREGGLAYLERSGVYFEKSGTKSTESSKSAYVETDPSYIKCRSKEDAADALVEYLKNKYSIFEKSHHLCKQAFCEDNIRGNQ